MRKIIICLTVALLAVSVCVLTSCSGKAIKIEYDPETKYGVYWYDDDKYVRSSDNMSLDCFDPSKPTFVFAHGWEPDKANSKDGLVEDLVTHKDTVAKTGAYVDNYAEMLKEQGYNVALLGWFSYASSLGDLFRLIWLEFDGGHALSVRFAQELAAVLGDDYAQPVKMVGHSYGSQLAVATTYQLSHFLKNGVIANENIIPTRVTLADPYIGSQLLVNDWKSKVSKASISYTGERINSRLPKTLFADVVDYIVKSHDIAVDIYGGMGIASVNYYVYDGSDADFEKLSANCSFVKSEGLKARYEDFNIHNIVRDWVLKSIVDEVKMYDGDGNVAPSGAASDSEIKAMRGKCYYQNYNGFNLSRDSMTLKDRMTEEY